ncbi:glycoside hydrolase family 97 catalytic domain-containing protein [Herbiconiux sp. P16]|uniref:glycoside hydrolase family 97 catalytic domain-containing protein n=1 Tax=Herbiconiux wuyangfengii TaxID=3342794 RepID=UPI0035B8ECFF
MVTDILPAADVVRGRVRAAVEGHPDGLRLAVDDRDSDARLTVRLGITVGGVDLARSSTLLRSSIRTVAETLTAVSGKSTGPWSFDHEELTATYRHETGLEWRIVVRLAADGVALRYEVPDLQGVSTLDAEATSIPLDGLDRAWVLDYQTWYETPRTGVDVTDLAPGDYGFPFLLRSREGRYLLVTESGIDGRFSGSHASVDPDAAVLRFQQADPGTEVARGAVTPWRVFVTGDLATVVETRLVDELAPPRHPLVGDASWVRPGRAAWSWWSDFYSGAQLDAQKHFVDVAAGFGWEHLLIDCGWEETWVPEIVAYASEHGIQVHLWAIWHDLDGPEKLQKLALWRSWGVAGIKVDFMESESRDRYRWYDSVLAETARLGMMVNFHGSVIPRGWARTWPQVVGYEAIRGSEYYVFYDDLPLTAGHNVIQPFTRNVVGAMDYTPVAFTAPGRTTSDGHELGMSVAFECGITNFADGVDAYRDRPLAARLLSELPPVWQETRLLAGTPDTEAVLARRSGDRWFVGGIATGEARTLEIPLARLGGGRHRAWVVTDLPGGDGRGLAETDGLVENTLVVDVAAEGGFAAVLAPVGTELFRAAPAERERAPQVEPSLGTLDTAGRASVTVEAGASVRVPPGWRAERRDDTTWVVAAPDALAAGALGVVAVETPGRRGVPLIAHARLVKPLAAGADVPLSTLPMLAFENESGPVERDQSNGGGNPRDGQRMRVAGTEFDHGFGVSTPSAFRLFLGGNGGSLTGFVGIDDETPATAAVAIVEADGRELLRLSLTAGADPIGFEVDLAGAGILTLRTERRPGDAPVPFTRAAHSFESGAPDAAHVDWASLVLTPHHSHAITSRADH